MKENIKIVEFLNGLVENNNREWFHAHKEAYQEALDIYRRQVTALIDGIGVFDPNVRYLTADAAIFRIYRDIRFSNDKTPYKNHFGAYIAPEGGRKSIYAGYYLHIQPGACQLGGGLWCPDKDILKAVRQHIDTYYEEFTELTLNSEFKQNFGEVYSFETLKRVPQGFSPDSPAAELLKLKHFLVEKPITEAELTAPDFTEKAVAAFKSLMPFNYFFNDVLKNGL